MRVGTIKVAAGALVVIAAAGAMIATSYTPKDNDHATVGVARSAESTTVRDVMKSPWSASPEASDEKQTSALQFAATDDDAVDGLSIARQSWHRGGLGSQALMSFTLRNKNDYPVTGIKMRCAFQSRDGSYTTERRHLIMDTVETRSRKTIPNQLVGFVNPRMAKAKCALLAASRGST